MNVWHYAMNQLMSDIAQKMKVKTSRNSNKKKNPTADWSWFIENMSWTCLLSTEIQLVLADIGSSHASVYILCLSSAIARLRRLWLVMLNHECKQSESNKIHVYSRMSQWSHKTLVYKDEGVYLFQLILAVHQGHTWPVYMVVTVNKICINCNRHVSFSVN